MRGCAFAVREPSAQTVAATHRSRNRLGCGSGGVCRRPRTSERPLLHSRPLIVTMLVSLCAAFGVIYAEQPGQKGQAPDAIRLEANRVATARHVFTVAPTGLPEQIVIQAEPGELPLELRPPATEAPSNEQLARIGRGPQLRAPLRLEVEADGKTVTLSPVEPAKPALKDQVVACTSRLQGGGVTASLETRYQSDGALDVQLTYEAAAPIESLCLVMDLTGAVDTVVMPDTDPKADYPLVAWDCRAEAGGTLWGNAALPEKSQQQVESANATPSPPINRGRPGVPTMLFWGSGDRGFTWLTDGPAGWRIAPSAPTMTLSKDDNGQVTWKAHVVSLPGKPDGRQQLSFTLLTHPAKPASPARRRVAWLDWPFAGKSAKARPLTPAARTRTTMEPVRADGATVHESVAPAAVLEGPAGGDAASAERNLALTFPMPLFRYLAGTHTHLPYRLETNAVRLVRAGQSTACDRMALGRALLHDIGVSSAGLAHLALGQKVVAAFLEFGAFESDGRTEFLPYWRNRALVRYGEAWSAEDAFSEHTEDPHARVYVSVWRRPATVGKKGTQVLIVVANETDKPVRQRLFVLKPDVLFGGANALNRLHVIKDWDFSKIPADSDWNRRQIETAWIEHSTIVLRDTEDDGYVVQDHAKGGVEAYGPLFVPAYGMRLLHGTSAP